MDPGKPEEIIKEIFNPNEEETKAFSDNFSEELFEFANYFSKAYIRYLALEKLAEDSQNIQIANVTGLLFMLLDNLFTSVKLFVMGFEIPSGNLMRQVLEAVPQIILCSLNDNIRIRTKKGGKYKTIHYFSAYKEDKPESKAHKAFHLLEQNYEDIGLSKKLIEALMEARKFYHCYSHPSKMAMATKISFDVPNTFFFGGGFDPKKIDIYRLSLVERTNMCRIIPGMVDGINVLLKHLIAKNNNS